MEKSVLQNSFDDLPTLRIFGKAQGNKVSFKIPSHFMELDSMILLLDEVVENFEYDLQNYGHLLQEKFNANHCDELKKFRRRGIWRFGSFIIFALNIHKVLLKIYSELLELVRKIHTDSFLDSEDLINDRKSEVKKYKYYRDKIFAHTAYGSPRDDNLSMQITSLKVFSGTMGNTEGTRFGGSSLVIGEQDPPNFEQITFEEMETDFREYFNRWHEMFESLCKSLNSASVDEIQRCFPDIEIEKIVRV